VVNQRDFLGMLAFDKWTGNADSRQAIFVRARVKEFTRASAEHPLRMGFVALMMDHGLVFDGQQWAYRDSVIQGLYSRTQIYDGVRGIDDFQPWLDQITHFPECVMDQALKTLQPEWVAGEEDTLHELLEKLMRRRSRVADLLRDCGTGCAKAFPSWN